MLKTFSGWDVSATGLTVGMGLLAAGPGRLAIFDVLEIKDGGWGALAAAIA